MKTGGLILGTVLYLCGCTGDSLVDPADESVIPPLETVTGKVALNNGSYAFWDDLKQPQVGLMWTKQRAVFDNLDRNADTPLANALMGVSMEAEFPLNFSITIPALPDTDMLIHYQTIYESVPAGTTVFPDSSIYIDYIDRWKTIGRIGIAGIFLYNDTDRDEVFDLSIFRYELYYSDYEAQYYRPHPTRDWIAGMSPGYCLVYVSNRAVLEDIEKQNAVCAAYEYINGVSRPSGMYGLQTGYNLVAVSYQPLPITVNHPFENMAGWRYERINDETPITIQLCDELVYFTDEWLVLINSQ